MSRGETPTTNEAIRRLFLAVEIIETRDAMERQWRGGKRARRPRRVVQ